MPKLNDRIKSVHITVRLGATPNFDLKADERVNANRSEAELFASGAGSDGVELLQQVLDKMRAAYGVGPISLCLDGKVITQDQDCA